MTAYIDRVWTWIGRLAIQLLSLIGEEETMDDIKIGDRPCPSLKLEAKHFELQDDEAILVGSLFINGTRLTLKGIQVEDNDGEWKPVNDPNDWYGSVCEFDHCKFAVTQIDGFDGLWLLFAHPGEH